MVKNVFTINIKFIVLNVMEKVFVNTKSKKLTA